VRGYSANPKTQGSGEPGISFAGSGFCQAGSYPNPDFPNDRQKPHLQILNEDNRPISVYTTSYGRGVWLPWSAQYRIRKGCLYENNGHQWQSTQKRQYGYAVKKAR
jgi:hypothetical protein